MTAHLIRPDDQHTIDRARSFHQALASKGTKAMLDWYDQHSSWKPPPTYLRTETLVAATMGTSETLIAELLAIIDRLTAQ